MQRFQKNISTISRVGRNRASIDSWVWSRNSSFQTGNVKKIMNPCTLDKGVMSYGPIAGREHSADTEVKVLTWNFWRQASFFIPTNVRESKRSHAKKTPQSRDARILPSASV